ncbi:MAG: TVP38/TMEM64 family protein [Planctomycetia bacterium]|nr:TVP38/TMEM64 family protein [Planctomycetia bacterium]
MAAVQLDDKLSQAGKNRLTPSNGKSSWRRYALAAAVALALAGFYFSGLSRYFTWDAIRANLDAWQAQVVEHLVLSTLVFFAVYAAITALSLPAAAGLTLLAGALFGRVVGTAVVSIASTLGATLAFLGSRYLFRDGVQCRYGDRLRVINEGVERDGAYYLFMLRLVPAVPFFLINLGMGLTPIRVSTYVTTSWLGMLLGTFLYVNAGTALSTIDSPRDVLSPTVLGSLAVLGIVPLAIRKLTHWVQRRKRVSG